MKKESLRHRVLRGLEKRRGLGCQCCGFPHTTIGLELSVKYMSDEKRYMFLCIDHVRNSGTFDRNTLGLKGNKFFKWIISHDYPDSVQILCHACNQAKRLNGGVCPHAVCTER